MLLPGGPDAGQELKQVGLNVLKVFCRHCRGGAQKASVCSCPGEHDPGFATSGSLGQNFFPNLIVAIPAHNLCRILQNCLLQRPADGREPLLQRGQYKAPEGTCKRQTTDAPLGLGMAQQGERIPRKVCCQHPPQRLRIPMLVEVLHGEEQKRLCKPDVALTGCGVDQEVGDAKHHIRWQHFPLCQTQVALARGAHPWPHIDQKWQREVPNDFDRGSAVTSGRKIVYATCSRMVPGSSRHDLQGRDPSTLTCG